MRDGRVHECTSALLRLRPLPKWRAQAAVQRVHLGSDKAPPRERARGAVCAPCGARAKAARELRLEGPTEVAGRLTWIMVPMAPSMIMMRFFSMWLR